MMGLYWGMKNKLEHSHSFEGFDYKCDACKEIFKKPEEEIK
jgi:hypothetical protein